ncbi:MAG TPA: aspartate kinase [Candidatus Cloacimonadota bacterium]|nr:aspartate kinase [Candidatus Cloacimonadota bacterium]HQB40880.1 aspartate kinase [Candidatus Cloacimonadota bacterium]
MQLVVKKFGGTSVATIERIKAIANHLAKEKQKDLSIVVVVSAMSKTTDKLISLAKEISPKPHARELDMLLTAGERITMSLLSLALHELGVQSISFTGSQSGIITDTIHGNARIQTVNAFRIKEELEKGKLVIVAGFQGVSLEKEITTLGRGGSDTSAVALSCYLNASKCEIYTDVDAVYSADPRIVKTAVSYKHISYEQMLYLAYQGSGVLQSRAVEFAYKYQIAVEVKSSFTFKEGTMVENMECSKVKAIAHKDNLRIIEIKCMEEDFSTLLKSIKTELFTYFIYQSNLFLIVEDKYLEVLQADIINSKEMQGKSEILLDDKSYASIAITGFRVAYDNDFITSLLDALSSHSITVYHLNNDGIGLSLLLGHHNLNEAINLIHNRFIEV